MGNNVSIEAKSQPSLSRNSLMAIQSSAMIHHDNNELILSLQQQPQPQQRKKQKNVPFENRSSIVQSGLSVEPFSRLAPESSFTELTDYSHFSFNGKDNDYIMTVPDLHRPQPSPTTVHQLKTSKEIVDYLIKHTSSTFDILTEIFASPRMKQSQDLQREAFKAAELWTQIADDPTAKTCVARCKLCGWGTTKDPKVAFQELQSLAEANVWEAYFFLGQCYYYGIQHDDQQDIVQPVDRKKAIFWYKKTIQLPQRYTTSKCAPYFVAQAQVCVAITSLISDESFPENVELIKQSANAENKLAEYLLGYLVKLGVVSDAPRTEKEYFASSAQKLYSPAQVQLALILLQEGKIKDGLGWLKKATDFNDPQAYYQLGNIYELGLYGIKANHELAYANYFHAAEKHGHHPSEFRLGMNYLIGGMGLSKDAAKAYSFIQRAALAGDPSAQYTLGVMYRDGNVPHQSHQTAHEIAQNKKEAFQWFRKAAAQNFPTALTQIASCYEHGVGVAVNYVVASQYYEKAVRYQSNHLPSAQLTYATFLHKQGKYKEALNYYLLASGLTQANAYPSSPPITRAAKRMVAILYLDNSKDPNIPYKPKEGFDLLSDLINSDPNDGCAHYWVGVCYEEGIPGICPIDLPQSYKHYLISANLDYSDSQFQVGHMLCKGIGVQEDRRAAFEWFMKASKQKHPKALYYIGIYYYNGCDGVPRDHDKAREYFKKSAQLGVVDAMISYAQLCQEKTKISTSQQEIKSLQRASFDWYKKAAAQQHPTALRELGRLYGAGIGTEKNDLLSAEYLKMAGDKQDPLATLLLGGYYENGRGGLPKDIHLALNCYLKAIQLGQPTALFAAAEAYEKLGQYDKSYEYYNRVVNDTRISKQFKTYRTACLRRSLYSLNYDPTTLLHQPMASTLKSSHSLDKYSNLSITEAFQTIFSLATRDQFKEAYVWLAECYQDGNGIVKDMSQSIQWRTKAALEANDLYSMRKLACMYEQGIEVERNVILAQKFYQMIADHRHS